MATLRILIACEFSGRVRDAFRALGHDAISADLRPTEAAGPHHTGDVEPLLQERWDLVVAHPPCTFLTLSGVRWLHERPERWAKMEAGARFLRACLSANAAAVCVENPIPHRYAVEAIGRKYDQIIHPWQHGHPTRKATCLWLRGLPPLRETDNVKATMLAAPKAERNSVLWRPQSRGRAKLRALTYPGIARAMANQWSRALTSPAQTLLPTVTEREE